MLRTADEVREELCHQITECVHWEETICRMIQDGTDVFIEFGAGKVLTGLMKRIDPGVRSINIETAEDIRLLEKINTTA